MTIDHGSDDSDGSDGDDTSDSQLSRGDDWEALARFLAGEHTPAEGGAMRRLLDASPEDAALVIAMQRALGHLPAMSSDDIDVDAAFHRVSALRRRPPSPALAVTRDNDPHAATRATIRVATGDTGRRRSFLVPAMAAAAVLAIAIASWRGGAGPREESAPIAVADAAQTLRTDVGVRDSIRLTDGTLVVLAPMSELRFVADAAGGERVATLRGEGFFDVAHDENRPFVVIAGDAVIRDVGTSFSVRGSDEREVVVIVTSGVVELESTPQQGAKETRREAAPTGNTAGIKRAVRLQQGDIGVRHADGRTTLRRGAATADDVAWRRGALVFRDAPFGEVADRVRRWYGVELRAADSSIAARHVTADLTGEDIDRVLQLLSLSLGAELERQGALAVLRDAAPDGGGATRR